MKKAALFLLLFSSVCVADLQLNNNILKDYFLPKSDIFHTLVGLSSGESVTKYKGVEDGWHKYISVGKRGMFEGQVTTSYYKVTEKGVLSKDENAEELLFPVDTKVGDHSKSILPTE